MAIAKTPTILDSNVVLDLLLIDPAWYRWSARQMADSLALGPLIINSIVFAESAPRFGDWGSLQRSMSQLGFEFEHLPREACFEAGKVHVVYRKAGGMRERTLPDFLIGAHAQVRGCRLLTRDPVRYRSYFPDLDIIAPDTHP